MKINKKRFLLSFVLALMFLFTGFFYDNDLSFNQGINNGNVVYAYAKGSSSSKASGSFKSGSFSKSSKASPSKPSGWSKGTSKSSSGSFKSGSFSNNKSKPSNTMKSSQPSKPSGWSNSTSSQSKKQNSKSSSGGFKSGSFSNTPDQRAKDSNNKSEKQTYRNDNDSKNSSWIPIPIPWGSNKSYNQRYYGRSHFSPLGILGTAIKYIIIMAFIIFIINLIKKIKK